MSAPTVDPGEVAAQAQACGVEDDAVLAKLDQELDPGGALTTSVIEALSRMSDAEVEAWVAAQPDGVVQEILRGEWWFVRRPDQEPPLGEWLVWLILTGRGWGKALDVATPIPTPTGWTTMGELRAGDQVLGSDGRPTTVTYATPYQWDRTCYRVVFSDGAEIVADADHQWAARTRADRRAKRGYRTVTTADLLAGGLRCGPERQWQMPAAAPLELPDADLPVDPYVLGFWLGDGDAASSVVTIGDADRDEQLALLADAGEPYQPVGYRPITYRPVQRLPRKDTLHARLSRLGVVDGKHIPAAYLRASRAQREALLAGLIDADGWVEHATGRIEVAGTRRALAEDVLELARTLGHRARLIESRATIDGRDVGPSLRVQWVTRAGGGRLARKTLADRTGLGQPGRLATRYVDRIEPVDTRPVRCISVDAADQLYLAGRELLVTHNTRTGAETLIDWILANPVDVAGHPTEWAAVAETLIDGLDTLTLGPSGLVNVLNRRGLPFKLVKHPQPRIRLATGQVIHVLGADDADVGRGLNLAGAWFDELAKWRYPTASYTEGLGPALRTKMPGGTKPRIIVTTTPKPIPLLFDWTTRQDGSVVVTRGSTFANAANLSESAVQEFIRQYGTSRLGRQELFAELLKDVEGALWKHAWIANLRVTQAEADAVQMTSIVVAVDPAVSDSDNADETGIVAVGRGVDGDDYVLADWSGRVVGIEAARKAWELWIEVKADALVYESNQGMDWVRDVMRQAWDELKKEGRVNGNPPLKGVSAMRGKRLRAEPVAARYESQHVHHVGTFEQLERQQTEWLPTSGESPDRLDALVHACTYLRDGEVAEVQTATPVGVTAAGGVDPMAVTRQALGLQVPGQRKRRWS